MKKTLFLSIALGFITVMVSAQAANTANGGMRMPAHTRTVDDIAKIHADQINDVAKLSPDQYTKVLTICKEAIKQGQELKSKESEPEQMKTKFKALQDNEQAKLKSVLTAEQFKRVIDSGKL